MAGDDFSEFSLRVPATYVNFGAQNVAKGLVMPLHSSDFNIDEACLKTGILTMVQFALDFGK
ncbi:MAG: hypothetical protein IKL80_06060 [Clostridia bacterium]|nr:hypothetical protein [Clostridia bacterium]